MKKVKPVAKSNVTPITPPSDVKSTLESFIPKADQIELVVVICLNKDGSQFLQTSNGSMSDKIFLQAFYNSYVNKFFNSETVVTKK